MYCYIFFFLAALCVHEIARSSVMVDRCTLLQHFSLKMTNDLYSNILKSGTSCVEHPVYIQFLN